MKKQYFINANIIDPHNSLNENGGLIIDEDGNIEAIGKKVNSNNLPSREKPIDLKGKYIFPGLVDMRVFVGEPGYEYKENFRTLSNAALSGGVTSVVTMPNTKPVIDSPEVINFLKYKSKNLPVHIYPIGSITKNQEGKELSEIGEMVNQGAVAISDDGVPVKNSQILRSFMSVLNIKNFEKINKKGKLSNKSIMFTGGFEKMSRSEAKALAEENGAKVFGSLSKKLNYLVVGNSKPTKSKIEKAESLNIKILNLLD